MMPIGISSMPARTLNRARQQKVEVRLLELQLAGLLQTLDEGMLELQLADEPDAVAEPVRDEQHEPVKVEPAVLELRLVEMEIHVARDACRALGWRRGCGGLGASRSGCQQQDERPDGRTCDWSGGNFVQHWLQNVA